MADSTGRNSLQGCIQRSEIVGQSDIILELDCFTDDSGTTFYGAWEIVGGTLQLTFYTVDQNGNLVPYNPTSTPIPCDPGTTTQTEICWIATADGAGYSQGDQIQQVNFFDTSTTPATLTATVWYNLTQRSVIATAPPTTDLQLCSAASTIVGCYEDDNGNFFDAIVMLSEDGTVIQTIIDNVVVDTSPGTLLVGRPCYACCKPSSDNEAYQHVDLPHADIASDGGFLAGTTEYNGKLCGDTVELVPFAGTVVATEVATSPEPIFTWQGAANAGSRRILLSGPATLRMGFASFDGGMNETLTFETNKPDRIFPGTGSSIASQAVLDALVLPIEWNNGNDSDATYFEWDNVTGVQFTVNSQDGIACRAFVDSVTFDDASKWSIDDCSCEEDANYVPFPGHIKSCVERFTTTAIGQQGNFSSIGPAGSILDSDAATISLIGNAILDAQLYEQTERNTGNLVTNFTIRTLGGSTFEFPPSALQIRTETALTINSADLVAWPGPLIDEITEIEYGELIDCVCSPVEMLQRIDTQSGTVTLVSIFNSAQQNAAGEKLLIPQPLNFGTIGPFTGPCQPSDPVGTLPPSGGYIRVCTPFDITLPVNTDGTFSDTLAATTTLTASTATVSLIQSALIDAIEYENSQIEDGQTVTNFLIQTANTTYEFPPSAFISGSGTTLTFTTADLVTWVGPANETITQIEYSKFDSCECSQVEMLQSIDPDTNAVTLVSVVNPAVRDNGVKREIPLPFDFGTTGPFPGPCPPPDQVVSLDNLCCDSDLLGNNPDVANQRLAWLDGADTSLMLDAVGGVPISGNDGDQVFEVQDKINPGVSPSFRIPATGAPGDDPPINPPTLQNNALNGLPSIVFDAANRERLRLDTGNPQGDDFTLFYLVSATDPVLANNACILSVGPNNADGDSYLVDGSWQIGRDSDEASFILRLQMDAAEYALGVDPPMPVQTGPFSNESGPSNPSVSSIIERAIATQAEFFDGQTHLITVSLDNANGIISAYFDGDLRMQIDFSGFPATLALVGSDYIRLMGNRAGDSFLSGVLSELFFANTFMTAEDTAIVNAYLICKWGIDPSLAAGGAGDLTLAPAGTYNTPTDLVRIVNGDGTQVYRNVATGLEFPVPPVPGLSVCGGAGTLGFDVEHICMRDDNQDFIRHTVYDIETGATAATRDTELDMVTVYNPVGTPRLCLGATAPMGGYIEECASFNITLPINTDGTFSDNLAASSTLTASIATTSIIRSALLDAQQYEQAQIEDGQTVTNFVIRTADGSVFEFPPSAFVAITGVDMEFTTADLVTWPGPLTDSITQIEYSKFDGCECRQVEMLQTVDPVSNSVTLVAVVDPAIRDAQGVKQEIPIPFDFGTTGPTPGPCPVPPPAVSVDALCCNDSLIGDTAITDTIEAWADAATDLTNLLNGGLPIAGNDGDFVDEILDPLGGPNSWDGQGPDGGPEYLNNRLNGLPGLYFSGNQGPPAPDIGNHLELLRPGIPDGTAFQTFFLFRPFVSDGGFILAGRATLAGGGDSTSSWTIRTGGAADVIFRYRPSTFNPLVDLPFATIAEFSDGNAHLVTVTYEGSANEQVEVYLDGDLRLSFDATVQAGGNAANFGSELVGIFRNPGDNDYAEGEMYETIVTDGTLDAAQVSQINAYLICKWGIDPTLAAGGAGDLTLAADGAYDSPTDLVRIIQSDGTTVFKNTASGLEFPVPPVPGLSVCQGSGDGCCECGGLIPDYSIVNAGAVNHPANTLHSLSVQVLTGTADINGVTIPAGPPINVTGDNCQNNIDIAHTIDNFTGDTLIITTQY